MIQIACDQEVYVHVRSEVGPVVQEFRNGTWQEDRELYFDGTMFSSPIVEDSNFAHTCDSAETS